MVLGFAYFWQSYRGVLAGQSTRGQGTFSRTTCIPENDDLAMAACAHAWHLRFRSNFLTKLRKLILYVLKMIQANFWFAGMPFDRCRQRSCWKKLRSGRTIETLTAIPFRRILKDVLVSLYFLWYIVVVNVQGWPEIAESSDHAAQLWCAEMRHFAATAWAKVTPSMPGKA